MKADSVSKVVFLVSCAILALLYGYGSSRFQWFPAKFLDRATAQFAGYFGKPHYVAPKVYSTEGVEVVDAGQVQPGVTLISTHFGDFDWRPGLRLVTGDNRILHEWQADPAVLFPDIGNVRGVRPSRRRGVHGALLFPDGDLLLNLEYMGIARLDACGNVKWRIANGAHHSISRSDDGTFWVPATREAEVPRSELHPNGFPGLDRPINHDYLLRLTGTGEVLDSISALDILYLNGLERFLLQTQVVVQTDLLHVNDVEALPDSLASHYPTLAAGDLLVSLRGPSLILILDPKTLQVRWYFSDILVQQHDPDFIGNGWIGVFNNNWDGTLRGTMLGGSQIVGIEPATDSLRILYPTAQSEPFYSEYLGKWQILPNGNMLLTEGRAGRVVEVDSVGRTVWSWIHPSYDQFHTVEVTEGTRYNLDAATVVKWPCSPSEKPKSNREQVGP